MITHDIVFHGPRTFDVEIDGAIRHAFTYGARTQRFEVETIGLLSRGDIYGGELEPLFLRLKENTPDGLSIVYILNGGQSLNDGMDDWLLSQMDPYTLPQLNMSPTETAVIRLQAGGAEFRNSMAFSLQAHEIPLSSRMALGGNTFIEPAQHSAALETLADLMASIALYLSDRNDLRLNTGITQSVLKTIALDVEYDMPLTEMDGKSLSVLDQRILGHLGMFSLPAYLKSRNAEMLSSVLASGSNECSVTASCASVDIEVFAEIRGITNLEASMTMTDLALEAAGRENNLVLTNRLNGTIDAGTEIVPRQQVTGLYVGKSAQPYIRYYDPDRISDLDADDVFLLGKPGETITLSSIIQSGNTMSMTISVDLETAPQ